MDEGREQIRKEISSILLSTPLSLTVRQLAKDYREVIGENIPYQKYGYTNLVQFLQSFPYFEVVGQGEYATVKARATKKAVHIDKLVVHQRVTAPRRKKRTAPVIQRKRTQDEPCSTKHIYGINLPPYLDVGHSQSRSKQVKTPSQPSQLKYTPLQERNVVTPSVSDSVLTEEKLLFHTHEEKVPSATAGETSLEISEKKRLNNTWNKLEYRTDNICLDNYFSSLSDDIKNTAKNLGAVPKRTINQNINIDIFLSDSEDETSINYKVPVIIQERLRALIADYPNGIWCNKLPDAYKKKFGEELDYTEYSYKNLMALCKDLDRIFHCVRPDKGDFKLYDKSKPLPYDATDSLKYTELLKTSENIEYPDEHALPDVTDVIIDRKQNELPHDIVHLFEELPRQWIPEGTKEMSHIFVDVGEIYDPSKFWIMLRGSDTSEKLDQLMNELQEFYNVHKELEIPEDKLEVGLYCAAIILNEYHRGIIVNLMPKIEGQVKVFFVDYGTVSPIYSKGICYLHRKFFNLPQQAIRARLANIYPPEEKTQWTREAASYFLELVSQKPLAAQIFKIDEQRKILELFLADTSGEEDIYINDMLVSRGHAIFTYQDQTPLTLPPEEEPIVRYIHLFPTFDELEQGAVPTATQMIYFIKSGIELHHIYPHYYQRVFNSADIMSIDNTEGSKGEEDKFYTGTPDDLSIYYAEKHESKTNISRYMKNNRSNSPKELSFEDYCLQSEASFLLNEKSPSQLSYNNNLDLEQQLSVNYSLNQNSSEYNPSSSSAPSFDINKVFSLAPEEVVSAKSILHPNSHNTNDNMFSSTTSKFASYNHLLADHNSATLSVNVHSDISLKENLQSKHKSGSDASVSSNLKFNSSLEQEPKVNAPLGSISSVNSLGDENSIIDLRESNVASVKSKSDKNKSTKSKKKKGKQKENSAGSMVETKNGNEKPTEPKIKVEDVNNDKIDKKPKVRLPPGFKEISKNDSDNINVTSSSTHNFSSGVQQNIYNLIFPSLQPGIVVYPNALSALTYNNNLGTLPLQNTLGYLSQYLALIQLNNYIQNQQTNSEILNNVLLDQLRKCTIAENQEPVDSEIEKVPVEKMSRKEKLVINAEFDNKIVHLIRYLNDIYLSVNEIQRLFFGTILHITKLKRLIANQSIQIKSISIEECEDLARELEKLQVVSLEELNSSHGLLHLILLKDFPAFVNSLSHSKVEFEDFDKFLIKFNYNSEVWCEE